MANREDGSILALVKNAVNVGVRPLSRKNLVSYYAPLVGATSYTTLSVNVLNPGLVIRYFPKKDLTNLLLFNTVAGTALYISCRRHLSKCSVADHISLSLYGSVLFTFGSVLSWAVLRSVLPENVLICSTVGVASSLFFISRGVAYMNIIDKQIASGDPGNVAAVRE